MWQANTESLGKCNLVTKVQTFTVAIFQSQLLNAIYSNKA